MGQKKIDPGPWVFNQHTWGLNPKNDDFSATPLWNLMNDKDQYSKHG